MDVCNCSGNSMGNTGSASGLKKWGKSIGFIMVPTFADDGTENRILCSDTFDEAYLTARLNDKDKSKRWYPVMNVKELDQPKADPVTQTLGDGTVLFVEEGVRTATMQIYKDATTVLLGALKQAGCSSFSVYKVDNCGQIQGEGITDGYVNPLVLADDTFNAFMNFATDTTQQSITLNWQYDKLVLDERLVYVPKSEIEPDLTKINGLVDLIGTTSNPATTGADIQILAKDNTCGAELPFKAAVQDDFVDNVYTPATVYNKTQDSSIAVTVDVSDAVNGNYVIAHAAQAPNDVIEVRLDVEGFEMAVATYVIP